MASAIVAALHFLALGVGLPAVFLRGRALKGTLDRDGLKRVFAADAWWGLAAFLWILTGPARAFGPLEKGTHFYVTSQLFWLKVGLFLLIVALEIGPAMTIMRWRAQLKRGQEPDTSKARALYTLNHVELGLVVVIVFVASFMARGFGH